jgi:hypothetical protein
MFIFSLLLNAEEVPVFLDYNDLLTAEVLKLNEADFVAG